MKLTADKIIRAAGWLGEHTGKALFFTIGAGLIVSAIFSSEISRCIIGILGAFICLITMDREPGK